MSASPRVDDDPAAIANAPQAAAWSVWEDLRLVFGPSRPHTLLVGPMDAAASIVDAWFADFAGPVHRCDCTTSFDLNPDAQTIVLWNVDALDVRSQDRLMVQLEAAGTRVQIVSVARHSPFTRVQYGLFLERLYRQLSTIYISLEDSTSAGEREYE